MTTKDGAGGRLLLVAVITGAHGIRGAVRVRSFTADPAAVVTMRPLLLEGERPVRLALQSVANDMLIARPEGVADRNAAEKLAGARLYVPREALPEAAEEEYYHADLLGLAAERADGRRLGEVVALHNFGAGDIIEVRPPGGKTVLLPFDRETVPVVDVAGGRLIVDPPAGLLPDEDMEEGDGHRRSQ